MTSQTFPASTSQLDGIAARFERRNFLLGVVNGGIFNLAETLIDPTLVLAVFVSQLTGSSLLIGLLFPLRDGGWLLPQFWVSSFLQSRPRQLPLYTAVAFLRAVAWGLMALAPFVLHDRGWLLAVVFGAYAVARLGAGLSGLSFMGVVAKTVRPVRRGPYYSWRNLSGGLLAIGGGLLVDAVLSHKIGLSFPQDFGLLFALSFVLGTVGMFVFSFVIEPKDRTLQPSTPVRQQWQRARSLLAGDANYRNMLILRSLLLFGQMAMPFYAVYALRSLSATAVWIGIFLTARTASSLIATAVWGRLSAHYGNRLVVALSAVLGLVSVALILGTVELAEAALLSLNMALLLLTFVFILVGMHTSALDTSGAPLLLDMAPSADRTLYVGFAHTILGFVLLSTVVSGVIVDWAGLPFLFALSLALYAAACFYALRVKEPRKMSHAVMSG